jgi:O-antigen ligase
VNAQRLPPSNRISSILLFLTVAAAPLPLGSADPPTIAFWCAVLGVAVMFASLRGLRRQHVPLISLAVIVFLAYGFVLHEQLSARPWVAQPHPLWSKAAEALGTSIAPSVSVVRNQPYVALGAPLANALAIICSFIVCIDRERARQLILVIAWSGATYAVYGILAYVTDPTRILWYEKLSYRDVLTSTFVNRNTAAVYFGSCGTLWLLLLSQKIRHRLPPGPIYWRNVSQLFLTRPILLPSILLLICVAAMLMTSSRAGVVISLMALVIAFVAFFNRDLSARGAKAATLAVSVMIALVFLQALGGNVSGRFDIQGLSGEGRAEIYRSTLRMIADHPWFGTGLGTFEWSFPAYRNLGVSVWGVWDRAHSTPLELASDLGLPLTGLIVVAWLIILGRLICGVRIRQRDLIVPVGALSVAGLGLAHSMIDFSLQIPGYSIIVFALVGAGLAQSFPSIHKNNTVVGLSENLPGRN